MPELPEVETIRKSLAPVLIGQKLIKFNISDKRISRLNQQDPKLGSTLNSINRKGKILYFVFTKFIIFIHLGMSGRVTLNSKLGKHSHATLTFEKDKLNYEDFRKFGSIKIIKATELNHYLKKLGPDSLKLTKQEKIQIVEAGKNKKVTIKNFLLNQNIISGIGNIYCSEILFLSKIHPNTKVVNLNNDEWEKIFTSIKKILKSAIKNNGTTLDDLTYYLPYGEFGKNQNFLNVYQKEICILCNSKIDKIYIDKRSSYFCGKCQKLKN